MRNSWICRSIGGQSQGFKGQIFLYLRYFQCRSNISSTRTKEISLSGKRVRLSSRTKQSMQNKLLVTIISEFTINLYFFLLIQGCHL